MTLDAATLALLAAAGFLASFIDSQVGGGGVISLPALIAVGLPPHLALGTNKLAGTGSALMASFNYARRGLVPWRLALPLGALSFVAAFAGVQLALSVDGRLVLYAVLAVMAAMTLYTVRRPRFGTADRSGAPSDLQLLGMGLSCIAIGMYDGFLGPGTGSFLLFAVVGWLGLGFRRAAGLGRVLNVASNLAALALFVAHGMVAWQPGLVMLAAMLAGAYVGSHVAIRHGDRYLKPLFVGVTLVLMARILWSLA